MDLDAAGGPIQKSKTARTPIVGVARRILEKRMANTARGAFFRTETGKPFTSAHIGHFVLSRIDRAPIAKFTTHDLRRTVATMLAEMGISFEVIAAVVGHESGAKDTRTLVRHYVRSDLIERKRTVLETWDRRLDEIVNGVHVTENVTRLGEGSATRAA